MRTKTIRNVPRFAHRVGFTLIELLVVIAIIAALMALTASAVIKYLGSQQAANTQSTLDRTQAALNAAYSKVKDDAYSPRSSMSEPVPANAVPPPTPTTSTVGAWIAANLASNAGNPNDPNVTGRTRVIYVKLRLRQAFPMNFNEALNPAPLPPLPAYQTYLTNLGITGSSPATASFESSTCLLMALQRGVSGAGIDPSDLTKGGATGSFTIQPPSPAAGKSFSYLTDAWGSPISFSRVPVGSPTLNTNPFPGGGQQGANDPLDPQGYLQAGGWAMQNGQLTPQAQLFVALTQQQLAGLNSSYKQAPLLASVGPDKTAQFDPITFQRTALGTDDQFSNP
jgi:prepilin-type N-terminal cleavage/methylation domain-containing protein